MGIYYDNGFKKHSTFIKPRELDQQFLIVLILYICLVKAVMVKSLAT